MTNKNRQAKEGVIRNLTEELQGAKSAVLVDFTKMGMEAQTGLKNKLREVGSHMFVAKNTLLKIAITDAKLPKELTEDAVLSGQTAIIIGSKELNADSVAPIQAFGKFLGESDGIGKFKAGYVDGAFTDETGLLTISKLPSKSVLAGQTVGAIAGPLYGLVSNLQANMQELIGILSSKSS